MSVCSYEFKGGIYSPQSVNWWSQCLMELKWINKFLFSVISFRSVCKYLMFCICTWPETIKSSFFDFIYLIFFPSFILQCSCGWSYSRLCRNTFILSLKKKESVCNVRKTHPVLYTCLILFPQWLENKYPSVTRIHNLYTVYIHIYICRWLTVTL